MPGYLGRVLDEDGAPVGTCFQVSPGVLVTAWHVLDAIGAASDGAPVRVDPLAGGAAFGAVVVRFDPLRDLAVLTCDAALPAVAGELTATGQMKLRTEVSVTGHSVIEGSGHTARSLTTIGRWTGPAMWEQAVPTGRMTAEALMPGMSGAPVIRDSDGAVAGVVSGRYNSADGWLARTVWVARTEDLLPLLAGIATVSMPRPPLAGPVDLLLTVTAGQVRLTGPGGDVAAPHDGVRAGLAEAVNEMRRSRGRVGLPARAETGTQLPAEGAALGRAARLLAESFLPGPVAAELGRVLAAAERAHQPVRLGLTVPPELAGLPWEALPRPDGRGPLALHPLVSLFRKTDAAGARLLPGPLRIVVAIAAPDSGGGAVLDYEEELRNVLAAVRAARQDAADVRVVPFATPAAIRDELGRGRLMCCTFPGTAPPARWTWKTRTARPGRSPPRVPGPGHPARPDATGDQPGGLLHRRGRQPGRGVLRRPALRTGRGGGDRHRDLHHRYLRHPAAGPPVRHPGPQPGPRTSSPRCPMRGVKSRPSWRPPRTSGTTSWPGWANGRP